jgi:hypothetical protein
MMYLCRPSGIGGIYGTLSQADRGYGTKPMASMFGSLGITPPLSLRVARESIMVLCFNRRDSTVTVRRSGLRDGTY